MALKEYKPGTAFPFGSFRGRRHGLPTTPEYKPPFKFTGTIKRAQVDVSGETIDDKAAKFRAMMARQ